MKPLVSLGAALSLLLGGCTSLPEGVEPVQDFDLNSDLGKWYEIARTDNRFERGMEQVTAEYSLRGDGGITVRNKGYLPETKEWKEIEGKAYPARNPDEGYLKVSFFGPFYAAYGIFELGPEGDYAFVSGHNRSYLWLLARTPTVARSVVERFEKRAVELGFETGNLVYVNQE